MSTDNPDPAPTPAAPPKRRWFQIHLSTAFMTMLATAAAMTIFFQPTYVRLFPVKMGHLGWPWAAICKIEKLNTWGVTSAEVFGDLKEVHPGDWFVSYNPLVADIAVLLAIILVVACMFEVPIRWDEAEKAKKRNARGIHVEPANATPPRWYRLSGVTIGVTVTVAVFLLVTNLMPRGGYGFPWLFWTTREELSPAYFSFQWLTMLADIGILIWVVAFFLLSTELAVRAALKKRMPRAKTRVRHTPAAKSNVLK